MEFAVFQQNVLFHNLFSYCENNVVNNLDPTGYAIETVFDIASIILSLIELIAKPSWANAGFLLWDIVALIPYIPGSYIGKGGKLIIRVADKISDFTKGADFLTGTYKELKKIYRGIRNIEIHHLVEKRFKQLFRACNPNDFLSIPLTKELHKIITKRWRDLYKKDKYFKYFKYGSNYKKITFTMMEKAIKEVYKDMPQLLDETLDWFRKNWRK